MLSAAPCFQRVMVTIARLKELEKLWGVAYQPKATVPTASSSSLKLSERALP